MPKPIVVGVDGSEQAEAALRWAVHEGRLRGEPVVALLAWDLLQQVPAITGAAFDPAYDDGAAKAALDAAVDRAVGTSGAGVERRVVCDLPARALIAASADASMIVVGARGLGGFGGLLLGSVSSQTAHHARCPVVIVRPSA
jgi:nucleotide-binding universal stress UspA family protein